jgi:hypothetical protein
MKKTSLHPDYEKYHTFDQRINGFYAFYECKATTLPFAGSLYERSTGLLVYRPLLDHRNAFYE